jgi:hypothetical protein
VNEPPHQRSADAKRPSKVYDPQAGMNVPSGLREAAASPRPANRLTEPSPASPDVMEEAGPATPLEYRRTEYGSADYEWEPTYSEAPEYEDEADEPAEVAVPVKPEEAYMYETPEWERPQSEPPRLDSARHPGWAAGFSEQTMGDASAVRRRRSIPRAE